MIRIEKYFSYTKTKRKITQDVIDRLIVVMGYNFPEDFRYPYKKQIGIFVQIGWIGFKSSFVHKRNFLKHIQFPIYLRYWTNKRIVVFKNGKWTHPMLLGFEVWENVDIVVRSITGMRRLTLGD